MANPPSRTTLDFGLMVRSVLALGLLVVAFWGVGQFFTDEPDVAAREVDYVPIVESARRQADFPVLAPPSLPDGWKATSARLESDGRWTLSVLDSDEEYLGIDQSANGVASVVERLAEGSEPAGSAPVAGRVWQVHAGPGDRITYVVREDDITTAVTGTTSQADLENYIESLKAE